MQLARPHRAVLHSVAAAAADRQEGAGYLGPRAHSPAGRFDSSPAPVSRGTVAVRVRVDGRRRLVRFRMFLVAALVSLVGGLLGSDVHVQVRHRGDA